MILEAAGYRVDATGDSEEVLARCHGRHYDIAFIDINMTTIGGLQLIRYIRDLSKEATIVIVSQYGTMAKVVEAMKLGAVDFIEKPVDSNRIHLLCDEILQRQQLKANESVNELLRLAELALERNAYIEARMYLKTAMLREGDRREPYYWLSELCENRGEIREALHYYFRALDVGPTYQPARKALNRLKRLAAGTSVRIRLACGSPLAPVTARTAGWTRLPMRAIHSEKWTSPHDRLSKSLRS
jgi:ActR/RegA family two-component response regulator